tara:strand:- start:1859 stop:2407 length:549 start_codon:yes stop_codon:yes gene_type:complete
MIITGNPKEGIAQALHKLYPNAVFCSRESGYELTNTDHIFEFANMCTKHDIIILNSALWRFHQTILLDLVYKALRTAKSEAHIVCVGSTVDRTKKGQAWLYGAEKKALRDYCNSLALLGVWHSGPKISYISFGTLDNNKDKHPDRKCLSIDQAAQYIKWLIDQPKDVNINEISIDPMQERKE